MVPRMKRAAILVLAIATLVTIVSPSAFPLASTTYTPTKSGTSAGPGIVSGATYTPGPTTTSGGGTGGGTDQGDADGLSGLKIKPVTQSSYSTVEWVTITMMMWWRYMVLIR